MRFVTLAALLFVATPAMAGEGLFCTGQDSLSVRIPLGGTSGINPLSAEIMVGKQLWTTEAGHADAIQIAPAQSVGLDDRLYFDFTTPDQVGIIARVRLFRVPGDEGSIGGLLDLGDVGSWAISCDFG
ncbi:MAG: hypothetical protein ABIQ30_02340 [Devosia sp.]